MVLLNNIIGIIAILSAIWVIYDVWTTKKRRTKTEKILWTILAILFSIITAFIYYITQKK